MSSVSAHVDEAVETAAMARLIPGEITNIRSGIRKPPSSAGKIRREKFSKVAEMPILAAEEDKLAFLLPPPMLSRDAWRWLRSVFADLALVTLDWLIIGAALVPMRAIFPRTRVFTYGAGTPLFLLGIALLHGALITLIGYSGGLYTSVSEMREQNKALANSVLWATTLLAVAFLLQGSPVARTGLFLAAGLLHWGALWAWRRGFSAQTRPEILPENLRNVLIVGAGPVGRQLASYIRRRAGTSRKVCGFLDDERPIGDGILGGVGDLATLARRWFIDEVILAAPLDRDFTQNVLHEARRLRLDVEIVPQLFGCRPAGESIEGTDLPMICLHAERLPTAALACKRLFDVLGAALSLTFLSPLLAVIAVMIKLDSVGPILYRAQRAGRKGVPFPCFKFRTMVRNADELKEVLRRENQRSGPFFKIAGDPRITRVGRFLRRYSLDELPQLWNVLRGEMSMIGPRPHPLDDFAGYQTEHLARLDMTPGITGLWQVTARRDPSFQRGMELDREYIQRWSLGLDLQILVKTIFAVVHGGGE